MKNSKKILFILSVACLALGGALILLGFFLEFFTDNGRAGAVISGIGSLFDVAAIVLIVINSVKNGFAPINNYPSQKPVRTVNVKEIKETPEERLYKQYEQLYKEGLITKEELDKKKDDLLKK